LPYKFDYLINTIYKYLGLKYKLFGQPQRSGTTDRFAKFKLKFLVTNYAVALMWLLVWLWTWLRPWHGI